MMDEGGIDSRPAVRPTPWAHAARSIGVATAGAAIVLLAPGSAHADDDRGLLGGLLGHVTDAVGGIVDPVLDPLGTVITTTPVVGPVLGPVVGGIGASNPVGTITQPVTGAVDGLLGGTLGRLPIVGPLVGSTPTGSLVAPIGGVVDGILVGLAPGASGIPGDGATPNGPGSGAPGTAIPGSPDGSTADPGSPAQQIEAWFDAQLSGVDEARLAAASTVDSRDVMTGGTAMPVGPGLSPFGGPQDDPATVLPSAWTSSLTIPLGSYADLVFAALLVTLLVSLTVATRSRAPPRLVGEVDSSPD